MNSSIPIPKLIQLLISEGVWPCDDDSARQQHTQPIIPKDVVRRFAPEETDIFLYPPPFGSVRAMIEHGETFWDDPRAAASEIDPDRTVLIGDFGLGSDAPIALDYRKSETDPTVIRLRWAQNGNHWVEIAPNLETFVEFLKR